MEDAEKFIELVENFWSEIITYLNGKRPKSEDKKRLQTQLAKNPNAIGYSIEDFLKNLTITKDISLDDNWATFRWFQVNKIFALHLACSYDSLKTIKDSEKAYEKLVHDVIDAQYLIVALLEGGFATKEKKLIDWWKLLSPNGLLCQ